MKKVLKTCSIFMLMIFSFYYTEKIALYAQNTTPLKKEIKAFKESHNVSSINAKIDGNEIIPGLNGLKVNIEKSYKAMKIYNMFIEKDVVYDEIIPIISIKDYPKKIIVSGNVQRKAVSIIISKNNKNKNYFDENKIKYIYDNESKYCIILNEDNCSGIKQRVKTSVYLNNTNFIKNINKVKNGSIIYVDDNLDIMFIDILIKHIKFYNLNILLLDDHLSESNLY